MQCSIAAPVVPWCGTDGSSAVIPNEGTSGPVGFLDKPALISLETGVLRRNNKGYIGTMHRLGLGPCKSIEISLRNNDKIRLYAKNLNKYTLSRVEFTNRLDFRRSRTAKFRLD